ncbi:hypothetical protein DAPPUDRAFT_312758 [Daphnia pulex]|uniref:TPX2 C-terminal domain-containing protein n=1 Tax=Daphnia pulex TaxID=6669 RepID=E9G1G7_DAPPU|nr:hypothetical protein DAPPUDRAFT_312758 [Daphnia pulex]|eukprot:EFX86820.1 hypothetical protein DAPPUDRAFT_312758 [Daphnia pulex]
MDEDSTWNFNAPQHYCDLPSALNDDDTELADQYFFAKADDTVYEDITPHEEEDHFAAMIWNEHVPSVKEEEKEYPVIRRRSRSVGSRPLYQKQHDGSPPRINSNVFKKPAPKAQAQAVKNNEDSDQYFIGGLRSYNHVRTHEVPKVTKPMPFNLTESKKKVVQVAQSNPSMAEGVQNWQKKTPERFHSSRHGEVYRMVERVEMRTTEAHTPQLMAAKRHRPVHALSREEKERNELEEMKKSQFKAHGVDEKVFKTPILPVKKEVKCTKVEPFHLTESHKKENVPPCDSEANDYTFHAKPAPKFEAPSVDRKQFIPPTIPQTPKFSDAGKASLYSWRERRQRSRSNGSLTAGRSSSNGSLTSTGERLKSTVVEPFSFEDRDKLLQRKKEKKIEKVVEEERKQREFHANPCPNFSHPAIPERPTLTTTKAAPFQLSYDTRGASKKEKFLSQLAEMRLEERKASQFKAQPAKVLNKEPFKVKLDHSQGNVTDVVEFSLTTVKRAAERKNFDQFLKEREQEKEMHKLRREQEKLQKESEQAARLREETVFFANPIRHFKTVEIKKADAEILTVPKTPKFMKK